MNIKLPMVCWNIFRVVPCKGAAAFAAAVVYAGLLYSVWAGEEAPDNIKLEVTIDPLTRYLQISYPVPADAPEEVVVVCQWSPAGQNQWRSAKLMPLVSETGLRLARPEQWRQWTFQGRIREQRAKGLKRTVVFNPYPEAQQEGKLNVDFRIQIQSPDGKPLRTLQTKLQADNSDVVYLEDWTQVMQKEAVAAEVKPGERKWRWQTNLDPTAASLGNALTGQYTEEIPLPQLSYPLNLRGWYAIFVCTEPERGMRLRLTGDERSDLVVSPRPMEEVLWRWCRMDRQHLVLKQPHSFQGYTAGQIDYVKLVPLSDEQVERLESQFGKPDKLVAAYFEPYSWAFFEDLQETLQHREPLIAYAEARVWLVDIQVGRFGDKVVYESRETDPLLYGTFGDPIKGIVPKTSNVGRMQQLTNTLQAELAYARQLGLAAHANFGGTCCYPGTPLESDFSKQHPEWRRGNTLRYEVPEVRQYIFRLLREVLEIGAPGLSIDFCRYPEGIDKPETCTEFLRELRKLREEFAQRRGQKVPLLIRFPAEGVRCWQNFDYKTWVKEGLVDYLCPSNIQGRHMHFDVGPYVAAVRGTECKLLPVVDGLSWGPEMPGPFLWRVHQLYKAGVDGVYVYQADARLCINHRPDDRRTMRLLCSQQAVADWRRRYEENLPRMSKAIYLQPPEDGLKYHPWERIRIWVEGVPMGQMEVYLDGKLTSRHEGPPYLVGAEDYASDGLISPGEHTLLVRVKDGDGWLEQKFTIPFAP